MSNSINRTVTANDFSSGIVEDSNNRPIILLNGESAEALGDLKAVVLRIVAEVDPSIDVVLINNTDLERVQQESLVSLFFPEGITVWWQGYTLGALQGTRDERVIRKAVMAASSRIGHQTVSTLLQEAGTSQFQLFHRAVKPEIQSWVELFVLYRFDLDAVQNGASNEKDEVLLIVRPAWFQGGNLGVLIVSRKLSTSGTLRFRFATFDGSGQWKWTNDLSISRDTVVARTEKVIDDQRVAKADREFTTFNISNSGSNFEFSVYTMSNDVAVLVQLIDGLQNPSPSAADGFGDRTTALAEAMEELNNLVGLESLKNELRSYANFITIMQEKRNAGKKSADITRHFVFMGSPGTGKTTVARIIGKILYGYGLLEKGHLVEVDRAGIVAGYIGQTAIKTTEEFNKALDGVFFVDEAYALTTGEGNGQDFGGEAISTMMTLMENNRSRVSVIVAGYPDKMEQFLRSNPGLKSRFSKVFRFEDYSPAELAEVFSRIAKSDGYVVNPDVIEGVTKFFVAEKTNESFGNARAARQLLEDSKVRHANRVSLLPNRTQEDLEILLVEDVIEELANENKIEVNEEGLANVLNELNGLVGLDSVKGEIKSLVDLVRLQIRLQNSGKGFSFPSLNFAFVGNPGTGKTTVARLLGRIFAHLGILSRGQMIEVSRGSLVAGYVGQTAIKTRGQIDRALDGVLFVDEAYALSRGGQNDGGNDFGAEAIEQILLAMENERERMSFVFAGYTKPMADLLSSNPGLKSRVSNVIEFPDYTNEELVEVFHLFLKENGYSLDPLAMPVLIGYFRSLERNQSFGNARSARGLFEAMQRSHATRVASMLDLEAVDLNAFIEEDLLNAVRNYSPHLVSPQPSGNGYI
jgi:SpoVK/Ycf46/Vps4 family AAA+-type ATPase